MYIVKRFDLVDFCWKYMNSYNSFSEAREAREMLEKRYPGKYKIFPKEDWKNPHFFLKKHLTNAEMCAIIE